MIECERVWTGSRNTWENNRHTTQNTVVSILSLHMNRRFVYLTTWFRWKTIFSSTHAHATPKINENKIGLVCWICRLVHIVLLLLFVCVCDQILPGYVSGIKAAPVNYTLPKISYYQNTCHWNKVRIFLRRIRKYDKHNNNNKEIKNIQTLFIQTSCIFESHWRISSVFFFKCNNACSMWSLLNLVESVKSVRNVHKCFDAKARHHLNRCIYAKEIPS